MNIQRFHAATAREALARARLTFGEGTLILSNRQTDHGVEVVATGEELLANVELTHTGSTPHRKGEFKSTSPAPNPAPKQATATRPQETTRALVERDTEQLALSTLSFQDYVRERMVRRNHENQHHTTVKPVAQHNIPLPPASEKPNNAPSSFMKELQSLKHLMEDRFNTLAWLGQAQQRPIQSHLMHKLIRAGYSATLARTLLSHLPAHYGARDAVQWLMQVLERNLAIDSRPLHEEGGIYAMVGPTGVGKTTAIARLAALCAQQHGSASVGVITLDTHRVGGHETLRAWVATHLTHDRTALHDLLGLLASKKMVLIDTTGMAPGDERQALLADMLALPDVRRLLVLAASAHGDTLDALLRAFHTTGAQQAVVTKTDEAAKLGPVVDALIRHKMVLRGTTCGQRVPHDWQAADARALVQQSMRSNTPSAFDPKANELNFFFSPSSAGASTVAPQRA